MAARSAPVFAAMLVLLAAVVFPSPLAAAVKAQRVARVVVKKEEHVMLLLSADDEVLATYRVAIGPGGPGYKRMEGDMTTPVGRYHVLSHQPSQYEVFLRLDYPTAEDRRRFAIEKERGNLPAAARIGGDIGIHGPPVSLNDSARAALIAHDWTAGCVAVDDGQIAEIARLVRDGTVVDIQP